MIFFDPLLLEGKTLVFKSLLALKVYLGLSQLIHRLVIFELKVLNFACKGSFFSLNLLS